MAVLKMASVQLKIVFMLLAAVSSSCEAYIIVDNWHLDDRYPSTLIKEVPQSKWHEDKIDTAYVTVEPKIQTSIDIWAQTDACEQCSLLRVNDIKIPDNTNVTLAVDTRWGVTLLITKDTSDNHTVVVTSINKHFGEYGHSKWYLNLNSSGSPTDNLVPVKEPTDSNIPIYIALAVLTGLAIIWAFLKLLYRLDAFKKVTDMFETERLVNSDLGTPSVPVNPNDEQEESPVIVIPKKKRLRSLDAFRGLCIVIMIFVNYHGGRYWFFKHSVWNGLTLADLVMPWFTFIIGTSIALSFSSLLRRGTTRRLLACKVIKRTLILFALGIILNSGGKERVHLPTFRIPGVLQRLAASYFAVAMMEVFFATPYDPHEYKWWASVRDIIPYWPEWLISLGLVAAQICLTFQLDGGNGCQKGYLGPGGLHMYGQYYNCTGGAAGVIDRWMFTNDHIYQHPTCKEVYQTTVPHDPEGILGTLTSIFICFLGLQAGKVLLIHKDWVSRVMRWLIWAAVLGGIAAALCYARQNGGVIPFNKNLWSVSFVLGLASMAFFTLTIFYVIIDVYGLWTGTPFFYPGMNSILVYVCHEVFETYFPVSWSVPNTHAAQLAMNLYGAALWTIVSTVLFYKGIFITI